MVRVFLAGSGFSVQGFDTHAFHQRTDKFAANSKAGLIELILQP